MIGWCIFSFEKVSDIGSYIAGLFNVGHFVDDKALFMLSQYKFILLAAMILCTPVLPYIKKKVLATENKVAVNVFEWGVAVAYIVLLVLSIAMIISDTYNPFLYFRF